MTHPVRIVATFTIVIAGLIIAYAVFGWQNVYVFSYALLTIGTLSAAATLIRIACEPNAKNKAFTINLALVNIGAACTLGWWSFWRILGRPEIMQDHPLFFVWVSVYVTGLILHLFHVARSWDGIPYRWYLIWLVALSVLLAYIASMHASQAAAFLGGY